MTLPTSRRPVAFTHEGVEYKAFPEAGSYFGVLDWEGPVHLPGNPIPIQTRKRKYLLQVPMNEDGSPATYRGVIDPCEVVNMGEHGDEELLAAINAAFGTAFKYSDFPGR